MVYSSFGSYSCGQNHGILRNAKPVRKAQTLLTGSLQAYMYCQCVTFIIDLPDPQNPALMQRVCKITSGVPQNRPRQKPAETTVNICQEADITYIDPLPPVKGAMQICSV